MRALHTAVGVLALAGTLVYGATPRIMASDPCYGVTGDPPISDPIPLISGQILDAGNSYSGVSGATVEAFRCSSGVGVSQGTTQTDANGAYSFALTARHYYYVQAIMTGPLAGMAPVGTANPTAVMPLGDSVDNVDLAFE